jgi:hypothetical protein
MGCTFQGEIERESEETLFPREIELKGKEEQQRRIGTNPKEREHASQDRYNIKGQSYNTDFRAGRTLHLMLAIGKGNAQILWHLMHKNRGI